MGEGEFLTGEEVFNSKNSFFYMTLSNVNYCQRSKYKTKSDWLMYNQEATQEIRKVIQFNLIHQLEKTYI